MLTYALLAHTCGGQDHGVIRGQPGKAYSALRSDRWICSDTPVTARRTTNHILLKGRRSATSRRAAASAAASATRKSWQRQTRQGLTHIAPLRPQRSCGLVVGRLAGQTDADQTAGNPEAGKTASRRAREILVDVRRVHPRRHQSHRQLCLRTVRRARERRVGIGTPCRGPSQNAPETVVSREGALGRGLAQEEHVGEGEQAGHGHARRGRVLHHEVQHHPDGRRACCTSCLTTSSDK